MTHQEKLIVDATVAEQAIRFPTDPGLLNESREISESIIDELYPYSGLEKEPRNYRKTARKKHLAIVKQRKPGGKKLRRGIKGQLQYIRRNLGHIEMLPDKIDGVSTPLPYLLLRKYCIIQHVYRQQEEMYRTKVKSCADRIVSISQPYVRPIVRGKAHKKAEFGAKLSVSLTGGGIARVDRLFWDAFHEGQDLKAQVGYYKERYGYYPEVVLVDTLYGSRENRKFLKDNNIRFAGKPLGRPKKTTEANIETILKEKKRRTEEYRQRIPIEGKFGQGKNRYRLNYIRAKNAATSEAWIKSIFLVMNLLKLAKFFVLLLKKKLYAEIRVFRTTYFSNASVTAFKEDLNNYVGANLTFSGILTDVQHKTSQNGNKWASFVIVDYNDSHEFRIFKDTYLKFKPFLVDNEFRQFKVNISAGWRNKDGKLGEPRINFTDIQILQDVLEKHSKKITIQLDINKLTKNNILELEILLKENEGAVPINLLVYDMAEKMKLNLQSRSFKVKVDNEFLKELTSRDIKFKLN